MVSLCTLRSFTAIDHQGTLKHHHRQSEESAQQNALDQYQAEIDKLTLEGIAIIQERLTTDNCQYGQHTNLVTTIALHEEGAEGSQQEDAHTKYTHQNTSLLSRQIFFSHQPYRQGRNHHGY